jgi:hypothetical protein
MGCLRVFAKLSFVINKALANVATKEKKSDRAVENGSTKAKQHQLMMDTLPIQSFIVLSIFRSNLVLSGNIKEGLSSITCEASACLI